RPTSRASVHPRAAPRTSSRPTRTRSRRLRPCSAPCPTPPPTSTATPTCTPPSSSARSPPTSAPRPSASPWATARSPCSRRCSRRRAGPATRWSTPGGPSRPTRSRSRSPAPPGCPSRGAPTAAATDGLALAAEFKNVLVLRTFSKAYGLAGLRVGYAVARPRLIRGLRAASTPFGVNALGQAAALAALRETDLVRDRCDRIVQERARVVAELRAAGWTVPETQGNFYWLAVGRHAAAFARESALSGAMVRAFDGEGVRVSVGENEGNDAVIALARQWLGRRSAVAPSV